MSATILPFRTRAGVSGCGDICIVSAASARAFVDALPDKIAADAAGLDWTHAPYGVVGLGCGRLSLRACNRNGLARGINQVVASLRSAGVYDFGIEFQVGDKALWRETMARMGVLDGGHAA